MNWQTLAWIVIAIVAVFVMTRGCGRMMRGMGCGMHRRRNMSDKQDRPDQSRPTKAA